jgi:hypothetical protein
VSFHGGGRPAVRTVGQVVGRAAKRRFGVAPLPGDQRGKWHSARLRALAALGASMTRGRWIGDGLSFQERDCRAATRADPHPTHEIPLPPAVSAWSQYAGGSLRSIPISTLDLRGRRHSRRGAPRAGGRFGLPSPPLPPPPPRPTPPAYPPAMVPFGRLGGGGSKGGLRWRYARHSRTSCPLAPHYRQPSAALRYRGRRTPRWRPTRLPCGLRRTSIPAWRDRDVS